MTFLPSTLQTEKSSFPPLFILNLIFQLFKYFTSQCLRCVSSSLQSTEYNLKKNYLQVWFFPIYPLQFFFFLILPFLPDSLAICLPYRPLDFSLQHTPAVNNSPALYFSVSLLSLLAQTRPLQAAFCFCPATFSNVSTWLFILILSSKLLTWLPLNVVSSVK